MRFSHAEIKTAKLKDFVIGFAAYQLLYWGACKKRRLEPYQLCLIEYWYPYNSPRQRRFREKKAQQKKSQSCADHTQSNGFHVHAS